MKNITQSSSFKTILIRTNAGEYTGIGHLVRCLQLAKELKKHNIRVIFVLDSIEPNILEFLSCIEYKELYDSPQSELNQVVDAQKFITLCDKYQPVYAIVDDYRLSKEWEVLVSHHIDKLAVIDDILREHQCDLIVDMKYRGSNTKQSYDTLVPTGTIKLLGPHYTLLAEQYRQMPLEERVDIQKDQTDSFNIMISIGGGGDFSQCQKIIASLLEHQSEFKKPIKIIPVLGPLSANSDAFINRFKDHSNITPLIGETDLYPFLKKTHLYIGAAGGTLYQLLSLQIPALTFAIADNQQSEKEQLEHIGHYFHLESLSTNEIKQIPYFCKTVANNYSKFKKLIKQAKLHIDGYGVCRITEKLLTIAEPPIPDETVINKLLSNNKNINLSENYQLRPVTDQDINHYLTSRNLPSNCQNMIQADKIPFLNHYTWWFNAQRESYLLSNNNSPCLYIWHEVKRYQQQDFMIGGWFVCHEKMGFQEALLALNWQLSYCQENFPNIPWIAVIHRENKFVKLLNKYLGFEDIGLDHAYSSAINALFNDASFDDFYYVTFNENNAKNKIT